MFSDSEFLLESSLIGRLFGGSGWITIAVVTGYLLILIFKSEAIRVRSLFLLGGISISLAIVVPPALMALARYVYEPLYGGNFGPGFSRYGGGRGEFDFSSFLTVLSMMLGPTLLGLGLLFTILAALPRVESNRGNSNRGPYSTGATAVGPGQVAVNPDVARSDASNAAVGNALGPGVASPGASDAPQVRSDSDALPPVRDDKPQA